MTITGAELVVKTLEQQGVEYIFGIPGAKIDSVFNALQDSTIKLILCRHEQNAVFMAAAYGRIIGKPGVVLVTSGPGVGNLTTGLLTATTEGDPVIAIGANVPRAMLHNSSHQSADNVGLHSANTKSSVEIYSTENIPKTIENSFRTATLARRGACFISIPQDVLTNSTMQQAKATLPYPNRGIATADLLATAADAIHQAKFPIILVGEEASRPDNTAAIHQLLEKTHLPVVGTFQGAGVVSRALSKLFIGRVGLFKNQPGDKLIDAADLIITIGYNTVEYDPETWNKEDKKTIVHIDYHPTKVHNCYRPQYEIVGSIASNIQALTNKLQKDKSAKNAGLTASLHQELLATIKSGANKSGKPIHPLRFIHDARSD